MRNYSRSELIAICAQAVKDRQPAIAYAAAVALSLWQEPKQPRKTFIELSQPKETY